MKRVDNSDINFKLSESLVNISNFNIKFYTVSSDSFFVNKNQDDVITVVNDDNTEYYIKLDWSELVTIGEGVLQYKLINNILDTDRADNYYNKYIERTTEYYINSNIIVDEDTEKNYADIIAEMGVKLDSEIARSTSADTVHQEAINDEIATRQLNVSDLTDLITSETNRATDTEAEISATVASNYSALTTALESETNRAEGQETALNAKVEAETDRATQAESAISGALDTYISSNDTALNNEVLRATGVESAISATIVTNYATLVSAIGDEETRAESAETALNALISANTESINRNSNDIGDLSTALTNEITNRTNEDCVINGKIDYISGAVDTKVAINDFNSYSADTKDILDNKQNVGDYVSATTYTAFSASTAEEINYISGAIDSYIISNDEALHNEINRATSAETAIANSLSDEIAARETEVTRATGVESVISGALDSYISSNDAALQAEVTRATNIENAISGKLDTYIEVNNSGFTELETALANEVSRATAKDIEVSGYVDTRVEQLIGAAPAALDTLEEIAAKLADQDDVAASIINTITDETNNRVSADTAINNRIDNLSSVTTTAISNEVTRATNVESILSGAIDTKLATNDFNSYSSNTDSTISSITSDIVSISGVVDTKLDASAYTPTDLSDYYTKSEVYKKDEVDTAIANVDVSEQLANYLEVSAFTSYSCSIDNTLSSISGVVDTKLDASAYTPTDLSDYYTKSEVDNAIANVDVTDQLSGYVETTTFNTYSGDTETTINTINSDIIANQLLSSDGITINRTESGTTITINYIDGGWY